MSRPHAAPHCLLDGVRDVDRDDGGDRRHHLAGLLLVQMEDTVQHLGLAWIQIPTRTTPSDQALQLLGAHRLQITFDLDPQDPRDDEVRRLVEHPYNGVENDSEPLERNGRPPQHSLRTSDGHHLRGLLADDHVRRRNDQVGNSHRYCDGDAVTHDSAENGLEQFRDRGLAQETEADGGHRDADLCSRQVLVDAIDRVERLIRAACTLLDELLHLGATRSDQGELRRDEEAIHEDEQDQEEEQEDGHVRARDRLRRAGDATPARAPLRPGREAGELFAGTSIRNVVAHPSTESF